MSFHLSLVSPKQSRKALRCFPNSVLVGRSEKNNIETENVVEIRKPSYLDRILAKQHVRSFNAAVLRQEHNVSLLLAKRRKIILLNQNVKSLRIYTTNYEDKVFLTERKKKRHGKKPSMEWRERFCSRIQSFLAVIIIIHGKRVQIGFLH